jgi:uracil-DNA glycosylase
MNLGPDDRQRAMLKEMGVQVWWPKQPASEAPLAAAAHPAAAVLPERRTPPLALAAKPPISDFSSEKATKKIALHAESKTTIGQFDSIKTPSNLLDLDWTALQQAVAGCRACALCEGRHNTVFGVGQPTLSQGAAPQADWLLVGEAPGENEDRTGEPFVGQAGQLLDNMLKAMGLVRNVNVYIVNVIKCRPPHNRNPEPAEIARCEPYLQRQIALLQPKIILAMGRFAATSLLQHSVQDAGRMPLGKLRGQVHRYTHGGANIPVVATYHPAYLLRSLTEKAKSWADLCLAMAEMQRSTLAEKSGA